MSIANRLETARRELLDLTTRSRLLHTPRGSKVKIVEVVDELSDEVFRILVRNGKSMSFLPRPEPPQGGSVEEDSGDAWVDLLQPEDDEVDESGRARRHTDTRLQTKLLSAKLQRRLLQLFYDARNFEEEQGVSILYMALGFLKWFESESSDKPRFAPLLLVPVTLERRSARSRFHILYSGEEFFTNLSLQAKLKLDFGIELPDLPDPEDLSPSGYCDSVARAVAGVDRWEVVPHDIVLGFFSFAKFLMYRDLDPENWPERRKIDEHAHIAGLLGEGYRDDGSPLPEEPDIDDLLDPENMIHVVDADSSQTLAIEEVRRGRSLVIQGPPGTGKSQTITNLIAAAVRDGKKVLFMAEKMAALDVVKRRLDAVGLGVCCLELHSHKARKKAVLEELDRTLALGRPRTDGADDVLSDLRKRRHEVNDYVKRIHTPLDPSGYTPYRIAGHLVRLTARGIAPQDYQFSDALAWTREDVKEREELVRGLAQHVEEMGTPAEHPWRGVALDSVLPQDVTRLQTRIAKATTSFESWDVQLSDLARRLGAPAETLNDVQRLLNLAFAVARLPPGVDKTALIADPWERQREAVAELVSTGQNLAGIRQALESEFMPEAWNEDLSGVRRTLNAYGGSVFRLLNSEYRQALKELRGLIVGRLPKDHSARLEMVDLLAHGQRARSAVREQDALGHEAFGTLWDGDLSPWDRLAELDTWERDCRRGDMPDGFRRLVAELEDVAGLPEDAKQLREATAAVERTLGMLFDILRLSVREAFGHHHLRNVPLASLADRLSTWHTEPGRLHQWIAFRARSTAARERDLGDVVDRVYDARIDPDSAVGSFRMVYFEDLMRESFLLHPQLATFTGTGHERIIQEFRRLDGERIRIARQEVAAAHFAGIPTGDGNVGEMGVLRREIRKQRRHLPLRQLMKQAGKAIAAIKPVFMMSPMSIAQYLEPGVLDFDLLLIDEASQVQPVDALGAIARSEQVVVVGDERQLPPTRFFQKMLGEDAGDDDPEEFAVGDLESILGLCAAQGIGNRMLRWHYRSRHESLIAVSNREFYDSNLFVVPSAERPRHLGLHFHPIAGGVYDRGGSATNRVEARAVARAVIEHAAKHPTRTLGVGTFSVSQRDAILDQLELLRREHPETEQFFAMSSTEPFFVKNLESIQGDERDVIFISVGYGKDASGYMAMNFGPLSSDGGERRLNVLITRARERCEVFSSISAADIDLNRARSIGVAAFKTFLQYAETGQIDLAGPTGEEPDSPFEEEVADRLRQLGFEVEHQVGIAGFFIDLAIRDPENPGRYLIGIECDGATYHSSRSARDRDRLREQVLRDRNWILHRIWSTDWFHRPEEELKKLLAAIERAGSRSRESTPNAPPDHGTANNPSTAERAPIVEPEIVRDEPVTVDPEPEQSAGEPYREADFSVRASFNPHEAALDSLVEIVVQIVEIEGPIHGEEVGRRLASVWGKDRAGGRIQDAAARALRRASAKGLIVQDGDFYTKDAVEEVAPRDRSAVTSITLRRPDMLPPVEIRTAVVQVVSAHVGATPAETVTQAVRLFGFLRTGSDLRSAVEAEIRHMLHREQLILREGKLYLQ